MADKEKEEQKEEQNEEQNEEQQEATKGKEGQSSGFTLYTWLILAGIVIAGATGGFALSQLLAGERQLQPSEIQTVQDNQQQSPEVKSFDDMILDESKGGKTWYYELKPVIANLDEPGITRYLRVTITLELNSEMNQEKGTVFFDEKTLIMRDWLTTYVAGLSLERIRGTRNLSRIKKEIRDHFNELLFPETKPFIHSIFLKEFAVQ
jgi:flagellar basal body-associated protein FliL